MLHSLRWLSMVIVLLALGLPVMAEEKNGVSVNVTKTTLDRGDQRPGSFGYSTKIDRTEGLKVTIRNTSFKAMPEGEVNWEILVRKWSSSTVESWSGKEKLPPLRAAEATDIVIGAAQIAGWRDSSYQVKDKTDWQISVVVEGKELIKSSSAQGFDAVAKRATKMTPKKKD